MTDWKWLEEIDENWNHPAINTHNNPNRDKAIKLISAIRMMKEALENVSEDRQIGGELYTQAAVEAGETLAKLSKGEFE